MLLHNPSILITGEINESLVQLMTGKGFAVKVIPFIQTDILQSQEVVQKIKTVLSLNTTVVFTSKNAVKAVSKYIEQKSPGWKIYCVGNNTKAALEKLFHKESIVAFANNATALAEKIISNNEKEIYFFCGDKRRDELPDLLHQNNTKIIEVEVYSTTILQHAIEKEFDGILFFSPSAVEGFFASNSINNQTILFAIGNTTADEIKKFSANHIVVSEKPGKENLVEKVIEYFSAFNA